MTDMIERAGRAALCGWNNVPRDNATMAAEWERMGPATREAWMRAMRAAIEAMREPTEAMLDAWNRTAADANCPCERASVREWSNDDIQVWVAVNAKADWQAMIDAALNPPGEPGKD